MSRIPTYILAPNFTYRITADDSSQSAWLGNIIADPLEPTRILNKSAQPIPPDSIVSVQEEANSYTRTKGHSLNASLWATFLQSASAKVHGERSKDISTQYSMTSMETRYFKDDPTDEEAALRIESSPKIRAAMSSGLFGKKPVYMITGLKVAKGFSVDDSTDTTLSGGVGGGAPVTPAAEVSLGWEVGGSLRRGDKTSFRSVGDVIFAYQLHIIAEKGWREKRVETEVYKSKTAFLGEEKEEETEMEASLATKEDLDAAEFAEDEEARVEIVQLEVEGDDEGEEHQKYVCVVPISCS